MLPKARKGRTGTTNKAQEVKRMKLKFKVLSRFDGLCEHDTGCFHSTDMSCEEAERSVRAFGMLETDPDHEQLWHNEDSNPHLTIVAG
jgi:hypothetical protein